MSAPTRGLATGETEIQVNWSPLSSATQTGGAPVISYHLQWDAGSGGATWSDLAGLATNFLATSFIVTTGLTGGGSYNFRVRAENANGWGAFSTPATISATASPSQISSVTTSIVLPTYVRIAWIAPYANSATVDSYKILLLQSDGLTYSEDLPDCDGSNSTIISQQCCDIPMSSLTQAPYLLAYNALVVAKVQAHNAVGWSALSSANTIGATIQVAPS
jgi:hypothetical protein